MRIYDGSPRQDWEEALRAIGAFADREGLKELLFLELQDGFLLQGLGVPAGGHDADNMGSIAKRTYELLDDQVGQLMDEEASHRGEDEADVPRVDVSNYYQQAMRIVGAWVDREKARDLFFFEQEGSFVVRVLQSGAGGMIGHRLAEFTRDEILAMIEEAPQQRGPASAASQAAQRETTT